MNRDPEAWARLGHALKHERLNQGLRQEQLAERAGVSVASVQNAEAGKVPRGRMPYTVPAIASALGWPAGSVEAVLEGGDPPGGWQDVPVQEQVDEQQYGDIMTGAMVRAMDNATTSEIREAVRIALDEFRKHGLI